MSRSTKTLANQTPPCYTVCQVGWEKNVTEENVIAMMRIRYTVEMECLVACNPDDVQDAIRDIDIPEGGRNDSRYVENTFDVLDARLVKSEEDSLRPLCVRRPYTYEEPEVDSDELPRDTLPYSTEGP